MSHRRQLHFSNSTSILYPIFLFPPSLSFPPSLFPSLLSPLPPTPLLSLPPFFLPFFLAIVSFLFETRLLSSPARTWGCFVLSLSYAPPYLSLIYHVLWKSELQIEASMYMLESQIKLGETGQLRYLLKFSMWVQILVFCGCQLHVNYLEVQKECVCVI